MRFFNPCRQYWQQYKSNIPQIITQSQRFIYNMKNFMSASCHLCSLFMTITSTWDLSCRMLWKSAKLFHGGIQLTHDHETTPSSKSVLPHILRCDIIKNKQNLCLTLSMHLISITMVIAIATICWLLTEFISRDAVTNYHKPVS